MLRKLLRGVTPTALCSVLFLATAPRAYTQTAPARVAEEVFVDSEAERYLRVLQVGGHLPPRPWSLRGFSPRELRRLVPSDTLHPWARHFDYAPATSAPNFALIRPDLQLVYNTAYPFGENDGAVWAGRGVTSALRFGAAMRYGPLSLVLAPEVFWTENRDFDLVANGRSGRLAYADDRFPTIIDRPQRFGDGPYGEILPGQSTIRVDFPVLSAGVSTANQFWGPADRFPLLLGSNAAGFPHVFVGTSEPVDLWIARVQSRVTWGRLSQSDYSPMGGEESRRLMGGLVVILSPRGWSGLEVGLARFYHLRWPEGGPKWPQLRRPLEAFLKGNLEYVDTLAENQIASAFGRVVWPEAGVELYGEFARDDHSWDLRDLLMQPDHNSGYLLGARKVWEEPTGRRALAFRVEWANTRRSHLVSVRAQGRFYAHTQIRQGHTERGQILGTTAAFNGSGGTVGMDLYDGSGRWSIGWSNITPQETAVTRDAPVGIAPPSTQALEFESLRFWRGAELSAGVTGILKVAVADDDDQFNLRARFGARLPVPGTRP